MNMRKLLLAAVAAALFGMLVLFANVANAITPEEKITATISPEVRKQLQKLEPGERKKMEAAIKIGNRYAPHHFDGTAYARNDEEQEKLWQKNIRPLVTLQTNKENGGWYFPGEVFADSAQELEINGVKVNFEVVCPRPELASASVFEDRVELKYRTRIIGLWKTNSKLVFTEGDILVNEKKEFDEVLITIDKNNRISQVVSKYAALPTIPEDGISLFKDYIEGPIRSIPEGINGVRQITEDQARARVPQYQRYIELIKIEETAACGAHHATSTNLGRE